ncbi:MAG: DUF4369 domain-containing protein [Prevotella sp.]|nr:DUF4369 domain-containing protein [Prevotella sp.]
MKKGNNNLSIFQLANLLICAVLLLASCSKDKFHVEGNITEAKDSVLYFENMSLDGPVVVDSVILDADGAFSFSGDRPEAPDFYRLRISNGIINISVDSIETIRVKAAYPTMSSQYEVSGSDNCTKIKELALLQQGLLAQALSISYNPSLGIEQTGDSITKIVNAYKDNVRKNYIFKEPHKAYAYFALFQTLGDQLIFNPRESEMDVKTFGAVATSWDLYYPEALRGKNLHNIAIEGMKQVRILKAKERPYEIDASKVSEVSIIDVPLPDNKGKLRSLKELKGQVVLLDFHVFASENSTERIMLLRELYNKYHAQGFEIYQVSLDSNEHFWKTQTAALPWICVRDADGIESSYLSRYFIQQLPSYFLIDRTNSLYKRGEQVGDLETEIKNLLSK